MTTEKVTFTEAAAIVPREAYITHAMAVRDAANMLESLEAVGDDLFQAAVFRDLVYLLVRTFCERSRISVATKATQRNHKSTTKKPR